MRFSLVVATLNRDKEVGDLLESLQNQNFTDFEVIIVDQNTDSKIDSIVSRNSDKLDIKHIKSSKKGLSYNRNIGLQIASGEIIAFPDDDCIYSKTLLKEVNDSFLINPDIHLLLARIADSTTKKVYNAGKEGIVKKSDLLRYAISFNIFLYRTDSMKFDEQLGCGAYFGSGEETDFLYTNFQKDNKGKFVNSLVYHPEGTVSNRTHDKLYSYGLGWGALFKKEIFVRKNYSAVIQYIYSLVRCMGGFIIKRDIAYLYILKGRIKGFLKFKINS